MKLSELLWIIDIYPLLMAGLILVMGALGDRIGYRKLMLIGSIIFGIASAFAAFAPNAEILILARALLALGASMILPGTLACLRYTFVDEKERNMIYAKADQQVIDDAVVLPNYYDIDFRLLQPYVRNCPQNAMEQRDFSEVYFVPRKK